VTRAHVPRQVANAAVIAIGGCDADMGFVSDFYAG
jgi:hypothetical protein